MSELPGAVADHYTRGSLLERILTALEAAGHDLDALPAGALAGVDEFHLGGHALTHAIADALTGARGGRVLDIGCGIGGAARTLAHRLDCTVDGIDLTPAFVDAATALSQRLGVAKRTSFRVASGEAIPADDCTYDGVTVLHVGMNVPDKARFVAEAARVLRPGGTIIIYDIVRAGSSKVRFPQPWATHEATSFVARPDVYQSAISRSGLHLVEFVDRLAQVLEVIAATRSQPPQVHLGHLMGPDFAEMISNLVSHLEDGTLLPMQFVATRR